MSGSSSIQLISWDELTPSGPLADTQELLINQPVSGVNVQNRVTLAALRSQLVKPGTSISIASDGTITASSTIWWNSTGAPSSGQGTNGDYNLDLASGTIYQKRSGAWVVIGSLTPVGLDGSVLSALIAQVNGCLPLAGGTMTGPLGITSGTINNTTIGGWSPVFGARFDSCGAPTVAGSGYAIGDTITVAGGTGTPTVLTVATVATGGAVATFWVQQPGAYSLAPASPVHQASTSGAGTGATFPILWAPLAATVPGAGLGYGGGNFFLGGNGPETAGISNTVGSENTYVGDKAGSSATGPNASFNAAFGHNAFGSSGTTPPTGSGNSFFGTDAGRNSSGALYNNAGFGFGALAGVGASGALTGSSNTGLGVLAGNYLYSGSHNTLVGFSVGSAVLSTGIYNVLIGGDQGTDTFSASTSNAIGIGTGVKPGSYDVLIGDGAGGGATAADGNKNVAIGFSAGSGWTTASYGVAIGAQAGQGAAGTNNVFIGGAAGYLAGAATGATYVGFGAGAGASGNNNTAIGNSSQHTAGSGSNNTTGGFNAGYSVTTGSQNAAWGAYSLSQLTTGGNNVAVGYQAGSKLTTGSNNLLIGNQVANSVLATGSNNILIGTVDTGASGTSNVVIIGAGSVPVLSSINTNTTSPTTTLGGNVGITGTTLSFGNSGGALMSWQGTQIFSVGVVAGTISIGNLSGTLAGTWESVFIGERAGQNSGSSAGENVFIGYNAGQRNVSGGFLTSVGSGALWHETAAGSTAIGGCAQRNVVSNGNNTSVGANAFRVGGGTGNVAVGTNGMFANSSTILVGGTGTAGDVVSLTITGAYTGSPQTVSYTVPTTGTTPTTIANGLAVALNANAVITQDAQAGTAGLTQVNGGSPLLSLCFIGTATTGASLVITHSVSGAATETVTVTGGFTGNNNIALGLNSMFGAALTTASDNVMIGANTGQNLTSGSDNFASNYLSGINLTTGNGNVFCGYSTGNATTTGSGNVAIGQSALASNTTGTSHIAIGQFALNGSNSTANAQDGNIGIGYFALNATSGHGNIGVGGQAGNNLTTGYSNNLFGVQAGDKLTTGYNNTLLGGGVASQKLTTGNNNIYIGFDYSVDAAIASESSYTRISGQNIGIGAFSMQNATSQSNGAYANVAIGPNALQGASGASFIQNVAIGSQAGLNVTTGSELTLLGANTGHAITTASATTLIGTGVGQTLATGSNNILIGVDSSTDTATASTSNTVLIKGAAGGVAVLSSINTNTTSPTTTLGGSVNVAGSLGFTGSLQQNSATILNASSANTNLSVGLGSGPVSSGFLNTFVGIFAGQSNTTGGENTFVGAVAGQNITTGSLNTALGQHAMGYATTESFTTAVGNDCYRNAVSSSGSNTAVGKSAMYGGGAQQSTAIGFAALHGNATAIQFGGTVTASDTISLTFTGGFVGSPQTVAAALTGCTTLAQVTTAVFNACLANTTVSGLIGSTVTSGITDATNISFIWNGTATTGQAVTVTASVSGAATETVTVLPGNTGLWNIALGYQAMTGNYMSSAYQNIGIGTNSLYRLTTGSSNLGIGFQAGQSVSTGSANVIIGDYAGELITTTGGAVAVGLGALQAASTPGPSVAIGEFALQNVVSPYNGNTQANVAVGPNALQGVAGSNASFNTAVGCGAGMSVGTGAWFNTFIGQAAGSSTSTGNGNTFIGAGSGTANTTGYGGTIVGSSAGVNVTTGTQNTLIGQQSGQTITTGSGNTILGATAGTKITTGGGNLLLGMNVAQTTLTTGNGNIYIGNYNIDGATASESNTFRLGCSTTNVMRATNINATNPQIFFDWLPSSTSYANDSAAATGGVAVGQIYRNGSAVMCRVA